MSDTTPILFTWEGDCLRPVSARWQREADKQYVIGETYRQVGHHERSSASHSYFFAALSDAWQNLPEDKADQFPNPEALRKYALIKAGYCDSATFTAASNAEAQRLAAFIKPIDGFSLVVVKAATVTRYTAKSQSYKAMGKADFEASKRAVLETVEAMIGVPSDTLSQASHLENH